MLSKNRFPNLNFGIIYFPLLTKENDDKKPIINLLSHYCSEYDGSILLTEENCSALLHFLNFDINPLNRSIAITLLDIFCDRDDDILYRSLKSFTEQLISWHPFFNYNLYFQICDLLITYAINSISPNDIDYISDDDIKYLIEKICQKVSIFYLESAFFDLQENIDMFKDVYLPFSNYIYKWQNPRKYTPLGYLEDFQDILIESLPSIRYDSNPKIWNDFWDNFPGSYTESIFKILAPNKLIGSSNFYKNLLRTETTEIESDDSLGHIKPNYKYPVESFFQYIFLQLVNLQYNSSTIKFCKECGKFYFQHHDCHENSYFSSMKQTHDMADKRIRARAENQSHHLSTDGMQVPKKGIDLLKESGFMDFHKKTFRYALRRNVPSDIYEEYTKDKNYTFDKYQNLPPIKNLI